MNGKTRSSAREPVRGTMVEEPRENRLRTCEAPERGARTLVLVILLLAFAALKVTHAEEPMGRGRADATFYYQVAQHVAAGEGLLTGVSLYHQGLRDLPAKTNIYPLWPLVLGGIGSVMGLERAAFWLPRFLYWVALALLYALVNRIADRKAEGATKDGRALIAIRGTPVVDCGHVAVVLLGTNRSFFQATSQCLTEGLAFVLLFGSLLALASIERRPKVGGALAGGLAGLAVLARSQFLAVPIALTLAIAACALARPRVRPALWTAALTPVVLIGIWVAWLFQLPGAFEGRMLLDWAAYRETPGLPAFEGFVELASFSERFQDMAAGLAVAFDPRDRLSYFASFGGAVLVLPLAILVMALRARSLKPWHSWLGERDGVLALGTLLVGLASILPVHALHATFPIPWWFAKRHGLPLLLLIVLAIAMLGRRSSGLRVAALLLGLSAIRPSSFEELRRVRGPGGMQPADRELVEWLDAHAVPPTCAAHSCREFALWSKSGFHWLRLDLESVENVRAFVRELDLDYVIVHPAERGFPACRALMEELPIVAELGSPHPFTVLSARPILAARQ